MPCFRDNWTTPFMMQHAALIILSPFSSKSAKNWKSAPPSRPHKKYLIWMRCVRVQDWGWGGLKITFCVIVWILYHFVQMLKLICIFLKLRKPFVKGLKNMTFCCFFKQFYLILGHEGACFCCKRNFLLQFWFFFVLKQNEKWTIQKVILTS